MMEISSGTFQANELISGWLTRWVNYFFERRTGFGIFFGFFWIFLGFIFLKSVQDFFLCFMIFLAPRVVKNAYYITRECFRILKTQFLISHNFLITLKKGVHWILDVGVERLHGCFLVKHGTKIRGFIRGNYILMFLAISLFAHFSGWFGFLCVFHCFEFD